MSTVTVRKKALTTPRTTVSHTIKKNPPLFLLHNVRTIVHWRATTARSVGTVECTAVHRSFRANLASSYLALATLHGQTDQQAAHLAEPGNLACFGEWCEQTLSISSQGVLRLRTDDNNLDHEPAASLLCTLEHRHIGQTARLNLHVELPGLLVGLERAPADQATNWCAPQRDEMCWLDLRWRSGYPALGNVDWDQVIHILIRICCYELCARSDQFTRWSCEHAHLPVSWIAHSFVKSNGRHHNNVEFHC